MACSEDAIEENISLQAVIENEEVVIDNVIACAASNEDPSVVSVFVYPRDGATNIQYFETENTATDKNNFSTYSLVEPPVLDVFNGYLLKFEVRPSQEKWVIVSFEEEGKVHLSNPIRLKQQSKPTEYLPQNVMVNTEMVSMPLFNWQDGSFDDTKIYFHVVSDVRNNLLSGTYTFEKQFQYYKLDNVVLNITEEVPPILQEDVAYNFTLLAVSEDNWVNLFSEISF